MDFTVLASSGYHNDCDRDEVANAMLQSPKIVDATPAPSEAPCSGSKSRKDKHKHKHKHKNKEHKERKEKKEKRKSRRVKLPAEPADQQQPQPSDGPDKGKARAPRDEAHTAATPTLKVTISEPEEAFVVPAIYELVFAAAKPDPPDLAEFPLPVDPNSTVAEIKEQLFQRERYLLRTMQFFYEGRELKVCKRSFLRIWTAMLSYFSSSSLSIA